MRPAFCGLYAVTPDSTLTAELTDKVEAALVGGACAVQYRNKAAGAALQREQAAALLASCRRHGVPLIVNDHLKLALDIGADGVHLGRDDGPVPAARNVLGTHRILGVSCYDSMQKALAAEREGADYVAFGSFFSSAVKPGAVRAPVELLHEARRKLSVPIVAIGGITLENATGLIAAGAHSVAVISALFATDDVASSARQFCKLFKACP